MQIEDCRLQLHHRARSKRNVPRLAVADPQNRGSNSESDRFARNDRWGYALVMSITSRCFSLGLSPRLCVSVLKSELRN